MQYTCKIQRIRACSKQQPLESWERVDERTVDWESFGWKTDDRILKTTGQLWMFLRLLSTLLVGCRFFAVPETEHQKRKRETLLSSHGKAWSETIPTLSYWVPPGVFSFRTRCGLGARLHHQLLWSSLWDTDAAKGEVRRSFFRSAKGERLSASVPNLWWFRWLELIQILWDVRPRPKRLVTSDRDLLLTVYMISKHDCDG